MVAFIIRRLIACAALVWVMSVVVFAAIYALPGNVAYMILGQFATPQDVADLERRLGLNDPLWQQYARWLGGVLRGDLGQSLSMNRAIGPLVADSLARSAMLLCIALPLIALVGIALGVWAGARRNSPADKAMTVLQFSFVAIPEFFLCIVGIIVFAGWLRWLPATGSASLAVDGFGEWARHLVLPVAALILGYIAHVSRLTRSSIIEELQSGYVLAARAKGLADHIVLRRHALPNALLPTITVLALDVGSLIGGIVVVETVFAYPGIGWLMTYGISRQDVPLILAGVLVIATVYAMSNLVADILYALVNPRIRHAGTAT